MGIQVCTWKKTYLTMDHCIALHLLLCSTVHTKSDIYNIILFGSRSRIHSAHSQRDGQLMFHIYSTSTREHNFISAFFKTPGISQKCSGLPFSFSPLVCRPSHVLKISRQNLMRRNPLQSWAALCLKYGKIGFTFSKNDFVRPEIVHHVHFRQIPFYIFTVTSLL